MEIRANYILVGLFSLLAILGILFSVLWLSKEDSNEDVDEYMISFTESVTGLSIGNPVLFSGIRVGQVRNIKISESVPGSVSVHVGVRGDTPVREDSEARLEMVGLTGSAAVAISGGTAASPLMDVQPGEVGRIKSRYSPLTAVMRDAPDTMATLKSVMANVEDITALENQMRIAATLSNLEELTGTLAGEKENIAGLIRDARSSAAEFKVLLGTVNNLAMNIDKTLEGLGPDLGSTLAETLPQLRVLITESRLLVQTLSRIGEKIESDPARFLLGNPIKEYEPQ